MSFKIGMLSEACCRRKLVYDQNRQQLAEVLFKSEDGVAEYALQYLDGTIALLYRNHFNQMEPCEIHTVPTQQEELHKNAVWSRRVIISPDLIMFDGEQIPKNLRSIEITNRPHRRPSLMFV